MNSVITSHNQLPHQLPSLHFLSKSNKEDLLIASDKLKQSGLEIDCIDYSSKKQIMFNKIAGLRDKANASGFPGNIAAGQDLAALQEQSRALAAQQQQRLLQMTSANMIANNAQESAQIKKRLAEIDAIQKLQRQQAMTGSLRNTLPGFQGKASLLKHIPSNTNSTIAPPKKREDEMTKPDLSTLADTAVALASARNSTGMLGTTIKPSEGNSQIAALLERRNSLPVTKQPAVPSSILKGTMVDILRNDLTQNVKQNYKRTLEEMIKSKSAAPLPSDSLFQSAASLTALEQLRAQHEQLKQQRRNSLPARATASEFEPLLKRQRMIAQNVSQVEDLTHIERRLSLMTSQERRTSLASSIASSATAPNLTTTSVLSSPASGRMITDMLGSNHEQRSIVLEKLNKLTAAGFPMPRSSLPTESVSVPAPAPAQITPEAGKDIIDIITGGSRSSLREKFDERQKKLGGFPFPLPLTNSERSFPQPDARNNIVSSHIRNNTGSYRTRRAPKLKAFKRAYNEIAILPGGDSEKIRMEMFRRGLQRGDLVIGRKMGYGTSTSFANSYVQQQRRLSGLSAHGSATTVPANGSTQQAGSTREGSIVI